MSILNLFFFYYMTFALNKILYFLNMEIYSIIIMAKN